MKCCCGVVYIESALHWQSSGLFFSQQDLNQHGPPLRMKCSTCHTWSCVSPWTGPGTVVHSFHCSCPAKSSIYVCVYWFAQVLPLVQVLPSLPPMTRTDGTLALNNYIPKLHIIYHSTTRIGRIEGLQEDKELEEDDGRFSFSWSREKWHCCLVWYHGTYSVHSHHSGISGHNSMYGSNVSI